MKRIALALAALAASSAAQSRPPHGAEAVYCYGAAGVGFESQLTCRFAGTNLNATPVPLGMQLFITDIRATPNNVATSGTFKGLLGRDDSDSFPGRPNIDMLGSPLWQSKAAVPHIILQPGDELAFSNFNSSDFPVDVYASGYAAGTFTPPKTGPIFSDSFSTSP